ncbi:MAG: SRPBCC family protein [Patescibacteria group bacterium]
MSKSKVKSEIIIKKPINEVFEYMASPHNGPAFIPNLNENSNIFPKEDGLGQRFDWRFNMAGVDLRGKAEVTEYDPPKKVVISSKGDVDSLWTYTLEEEGEDTKVAVQIDYEVSENALQRIANKMIVEKIAQKTTDQMLDTLKTILEL